MPANSSLSTQVRSTLEGDKLWQQERTILEATERICELMERQNVTRSQLADIIGKSKSHISQLLDGSANMTLRTLSDFYFALGRSVHITDGPLAHTQEEPVLVGETVQKFHTQSRKWDFLGAYVEECANFQLAG